MYSYLNCWKYFSESSHFDRKRESQLDIDSDRIFQKEVFDISIANIS